MNATTEGVVRAPSGFGMTTGSPFSMNATHELVVPRSIPMTLLIARPYSSSSEAASRLASFSGGFGLRATTTIAGRMSFSPKR